MEEEFGDNQTSVIDYDNPVLDSPYICDFSDHDIDSQKPFDGKDTTRKQTFRTDSGHP